MRCSISEENEEHHHRSNPSKFVEDRRQRSAAEEEYPRGEENLELGARGRAREMFRSLHLQHLFCALIRRSRCVEEFFVSQFLSAAYVEKHSVNIIAKNRSSVILLELDLDTKEKIFSI